MKHIIWKHARHLMALLIFTQTNSYLAQTGASLSFDGVNDFAGRPILTNATNNITIELKVFWQGPSSGNKILVHNGSTGGNGYGLFIPSNSNAVNWIYGGLAVNSAFTLTPQQWTHIAMVITGTTLTVYKDGAVAVFVGAGNVATPSGSFTIGSNINAIDVFNGRIDEVRFWTVARSACEIYQFMTCEIPTNAPGLLANYHFNQGTSNGNNSSVTTINDATSNGLNLTLSNFALSGNASNWTSPGGVISNYTLSNVPTLTLSSNASSVCSGATTTLTANGRTDLIAYYRFNEGTGSTTQDLSGNNLTGTITGSQTWAVSTASFSGASGILNFGSGYLTVSDNTVLASMQNNLSIEAWAYQTDQVNNTIVDRANYNFLFQIAPNGNTGLGFYNPTDGWTYGSGTVPMNQWVHVAMTYEGATGLVKFYLNGNLMSTHFRPSPLFFNAGNMNIGRQEPNGCQCNVFNGQIDELKIWRSVRTQSQIQSSLNGTINPQSYAWTPTAGLSTTTGSIVTFTPSTTTQFTTTLTDGSGCSINNTLTIGVLPLPTIAVTNGSICSGQSFTIQPTGANTYTFQNGSVVSPTANANYTVAGTSTAGCKSAAPATVAVTVYSLPIITMVNDTICSGESFTIQPSGATVYTIQGGSNIVTPTATAIYTINGTNSNGCSALLPVSFTLTVENTPVITTNNGTICAGESFTIVPNGAASYTIQGGNAVVTPGSNSTFTVVGVSAEGCLSSNTATTSIVVNALPTITIIANRPTLCVGETVTLTASGANTYTWSNTTVGNSIPATPSVTTVYTVTGMDLNNCLNQSTVSVKVDDCTGLSAKEPALVLLYPNPFADRIYIQNHQGGEFTVKVYAADGQLLLVQILHVAVAEINLENYTNGLYYVTIENSNGIQTFKAVKQ